MNTKTKDKTLPFFRDVLKRATVISFIEIDTSLVPEKFVDYVQATTPAYRDASDAMSEHLYRVSDLYEEMGKDTDKEIKNILGMLYDEDSERGICYFKFVTN